VVDKVHWCQYADILWEAEVVTDRHDVDEF
jgi:hypothetical protein